MPRAEIAPPPTAGAVGSQSDPTSQHRLGGPPSGRTAPALKARASVLVVDDHALLRTGVANIINQEPDLHVVAEAANGVEAVDAFERHHPDVTLLDLRMPEMEGVEAVRQIRDRDPQAKVIILTTYDTDEDITRALKAGAKAYVLKDISAEALITCIHDVLAGKTYLAPAAAAKLAEGVTRVHLTPRELTTLRLMADGKSNKEIAGELGISDRTVKTHLGHLFEKLGVTSRTEAVKVASRRGLVRLD
jgi:DNA-binding NarL/FixJ family response regulator